MYHVCSQKAKGGGTVDAGTVPEAVDQCVRLDTADGHAALGDDVLRSGTQLANRPDGEQRGDRPLGGGVGRPQQHRGEPTLG